jgi:hypothetical protein
MREWVLSKTHVICRDLPYHSGLFNLISSLQVRQIDMMRRTGWVVLTWLMWVLNNPLAIAFSCRYIADIPLDTWRDF